MRPADGFKRNRNFREPAELQVSAGRNPKSRISLNLWEPWWSNVKVIKTWRLSLEGIVLLLVGAVFSRSCLFVLSRPNEYRAVARIKVHREVNVASSAGEHDPYIITITVASRARFVLC